MLEAAECKGRSPQRGDTQLGGRKEKEIFQFPVCSGLPGKRGAPRRSRPAALANTGLSHGPARPTGFEGDSLGLSVGMSCPQQHLRALGVSAPQNPRAEGGVWMLLESSRSFPACHPRRPERGL